MPGAREQKQIHTHTHTQQYEIQGNRTKLHNNMK